MIVRMTKMAQSTHKSLEWGQFRPHSVTKENNMILSLSDVDQTADKSPNAEMQGWTLVLFDSNRDGFTSKQGVFRNGKWQVAHKINPDEHGVWRIPKSLERLLRSKKLDRKSRV